MTTATVYSVAWSFRPPQHSLPRYLCAACTCGQAISTALVREDETSPAELRPVAGDFRPGREALESRGFDYICGARERINFSCWGAPGMIESGKRKMGERFRMGLEINAIKEIEELKSEIGFFFSSRRRHTRFKCDWSSDVCSSD